MVVIFLQLLFIVLLCGPGPGVSVDVWCGDERCGLGHVFQMLEVIVIVVEKHAKVPLFLFPLLDLDLRTHGVEL